MDNKGCFTELQGQLSEIIAFVETENNLRCSVELKSVYQIQNSFSCVISGTDSFVWCSFSRYLHPVCYDVAPLFIVGGFLVCSCSLSFFVSFIQRKSSGIATTLKTIKRTFPSFIF